MAFCSGGHWFVFVVDLGTHMNEVLALSAPPPSALIAVGIRIGIFIACVAVVLFIFKKIR